MDREPGPVSPGSAVPGEPTPLRGHSALCLLGFRGRGYSPSFVERMAAVHGRLVSAPETRVLLLASPDSLCEACPNHREGCTLGGPGHEAHMRAQDAAVLARLGLPVGATVPWAEVLRRIAASVRGADLPGLCTTCPWLPLGWCAEGVEALRPPAAPPP